MGIRGVCVPEPVPPAPAGRSPGDGTGTSGEVTIGVIDDGPRLVNVPSNNALGLSIARALVSACDGPFELKPSDAGGGVVARIALPAMARVMAS